MEAIISKLVERFERGGLSRRELVQGLAMLAAGTAAQAQEGAGVLQAAKIDHVSVQVSDLPHAVTFYENIFGLKIQGEDKPNEIVRLGAAGKVLVSLHHKNPTAVVDHFAIGVQGFNRDAVTKALKEHGITPEDNLDAGFHIKDPEGMNVQIVGA
ncbi:MAG TPA: VOC family protein [Bryobacteraceae bacterium]|jgi:catechol-2,3-dioxygenase